MSEILHLDKSKRWAEQRDKILETVFNYLDFDGGEFVLDMGSGLGELAEILSLKGVWFIGVDNDPECVQIASEHVPSAHFEVQDACNTNFSDGLFDVVTVICILEHVENPTALIREAYRVCRPGGKAVFVTPNIGRPRRLMLAAQKKEKWERSGHRQGWDYHLLRHCLEYNGWHVDEIHTRFVDTPFYEYLPKWLGNLLSNVVLLRLFPRTGSELYAFCRKKIN